MGELEFLKELGVWGSLAFVLIAVSLRLFWGINKDDGRGRWVAWLKHDTFARRYRELLDTALNLIDRLLSPEYPNASTDHDTNSKIERGRAWSWRLLDLSFLLAVAYPILAIFLNWAVTGDSGRIGAVEVLSAQPAWWRRWSLVALMTLAFVSAMLARKADRSRTLRTIQFAAFGLVVAFGFAAASAFASATAGAFAAAVSQDWLGLRFGIRRAALLGYFLLLFAALAAVVLRSEETLDDQVRSVVLFIGFLPLLNAWADFASVGLTRWRLRCGVQGHLVFNAVVDAVAAIAIMFLLAFAIIATIHFVRPGGGAPLVNLPALFTDLRTAPGQYWWLGFMLFSTLLPTLIHLAIGAFALFTLVSGWLGRPIAAGLLKGDSPEGRSPASRSRSAPRWPSGRRSSFCGSSSRPPGRRCSRACLTPANGSTPPLEMRSRAGPGDGPTELHPGRCGIAPDPGGRTRSAGTFPSPRVTPFHRVNATRISY